MTTKNTCFIIFFLLRFLKIWACAANFWEGGEGLGGVKANAWALAKRAGTGQVFFTKAPSAPPSAWSLSISYWIILFSRFWKSKSGLKSNETGFSNHGKIYT